MAIKDKAQLKIDLDATIYDNVDRLITPTAHNTLLTDILDSTVDMIYYDATVGNSAVGGLDGDYLTVQSALNAGHYALKIIGDTTETVDWGSHSKDIILNADKLRSINVSVSNTSNITVISNNINYNVSGVNRIFTENSRIEINNGGVTGDSSLNDFNGQVNATSTIRNSVISTGTHKINISLGVIENSELIGGGTLVENGIVVLKKADNVKISGTWNPFTGGSSQYSIIAGSGTSLTNITSATATDSGISVTDGCNIDNVIISNVECRGVLDNIVLSQLIQSNIFYINGTGKIKSIKNSSIHKILESGILNFEISKISLFDNVSLTYPLKVNAIATGISFRNCNSNAYTIAIDALAENTIIENCTTATPIIYAGVNTRLLNNTSTDNILQEKTTIIAKTSAGGGDILDLKDVNEVTQVRIGDDGEFQMKEVYVYQTATQSIYAGIDGSTSNIKGYIAFPNSGAGGTAGNTVFSNYNGIFTWLDGGTTQHKLDNQGFIGGGELNARFGWQSANSPAIYSKPGTLNSITDGADYIIEGADAGWTTNVSLHKNGGNIIIDGGTKGLNTNSKDGNILLGSNQGFVGIGTATPSEKLDITETTKTQGRRVEITAITSDYITTKSDYLIEVNASSNTVEIELLEPNTANDGQTFVIDAYDATNVISVVAYGNTSFDVDTITNPVGTTFRYNLNGTPDLSDVHPLDKIKITNSLNAVNDGYFLVTAVDDINDWIEITNASGITEVTNSPSEIQVEVYREAGMIAGNIWTFTAYENRNTYKITNKN